MGLRAYIIVFLVVAGLTGLAYRALDRTITSLGCFQPLPAGSFMAYCSSPGFGDYEHGAYYYGLQPDALAHMRKADVLFFGTSRAQLALSTTALTRFFATRTIKPYLLGFGYDEPGAFPLALVKKYELKPDAIVILADPFFRDRTTGHVRVSSKDWFRWRIVTELYEYTMKRGMITIGTAICSLWPSHCAPAWASVYRSSQDGTWQTFAFDYSAHAPITDQASTTYTAAMAATDLPFAERFIAATGVSRGCIMLSAAPGPLVNSSAYLTEIGRLLGVHVVLPRLDGLTSFDGNHLSPDSAERWSAALLQEIGNVLSDCAQPQKQSFRSPTSDLRQP